jgi:hypothetical protein
LPTTLDQQKQSIDCSYKPLDKPMWPREAPVPQWSCTQVRARSWACRSATLSSQPRPTCQQWELHSSDSQGCLLMQQLTGLLCIGKAVHGHLQVPAEVATMLPGGCTAYCPITNTLAHSCLPTTWHGVMGTVARTDCCSSATCCCMPARKSDEHSRAPAASHPVAARAPTLRRAAVAAGTGNGWAGQKCRAAPSTVQHQVT